VTAEPATLKAASPSPQALLPANDAPPSRLKHLAAIALLGCDRAPGAEATPARLLDEAARAGARSRAGFVRRTTFQAVSPCPPDAVAEAPPAAMATLQRLLSTPDAGLLEEWADLALSHQRRVSVVAVPSLLDWWARQTQPSERIFAVCGRAGPWLAAHNPAWNRSVATADIPTNAEDLWQSGSPPERRALLRTIRRHDRARALAMVQSTWKTDGAAERESFLGELQEGCTLDDEPFLETALDDRSSAVRSTAASVLAALPGSSLRARMAERLATMIVSTSTGKASASRGFALQPPAKLDPSWARDGVEELPNQTRGRRGAWLGQVIRAADRQVWAETTGLTPAEVLAVLAADDFAEQALKALIDSVTALPDLTWAQALLDQALGRKAFNVNDFMNLTEAFPPALSEPFVLHGLGDPRLTGLDRWTFASFVRHRWAADFAAGVLASLNTPIREVRHRDQAAFPFGDIARVIPPSHADDLIHALATATGQDPDVLAVQGVRLVSKAAIAPPAPGPAPATHTLRQAAESQYAAELAALAKADSAPRPPRWNLSPAAVVNYLMGGVLADGTVITPKYVGNRRLIEIAVTTLLTDRALLLLGVPGTAKSWVSEHLAAAISGDSTLLVQGTAGTPEEAIRYGWNYALLLAKGPTREALVPSPVMRGMTEGKIVRVEELTRVPSDVQDTLITILSEKTLPIPELNEESRAVKGFNIIATANDRDKGVNELSSALKRRFNTVVLPVPETAEEEVSIVQRRVVQLGRALDLPAETPVLEEIRRVVTVFRELREGKTADGKSKLKQPSGSLSTAEAISVITSGIALAAHFGDGTVKAADVASGMIGAIIKDPVQDRVVLQEYLETVVKERDGWKDLYRACKAVI
jgi:MoxR-like ATPase